MSLKTMTVAIVLGMTACGCEQNAGSPASPAAALPAPAKPYVNVDVNQFEALSKQPNTVILDVRTADEYADARLANAMLIDVKSSDFDERIAKLDKSKIYVVHCRSGSRSARACNDLAGKGFNTLYNLDGGINAWIAAGKPVER